MSSKRNDNQQLTQHDSFMNLSPALRKCYGIPGTRNLRILCFPQLTKTAFPSFIATKNSLAPIHRLTSLLAP